MGHPTWCHHQRSSKFPSNKSHHPSNSPDLGSSSTPVRPRRAVPGSALAGKDGPPPPPPLPPSASLVTGLLAQFSSTASPASPAFRPRSARVERPQYVGNASALLSMRCPSCDSTTSFARCLSSVAFACVGTGRFGGGRWLKGWNPVVRRELEPQNLHAVPVH